MSSKCKVCGEPKHRSWPMQLPCPHAERLLAEARAEVEAMRPVVDAALRLTYTACPTHEVEARFEAAVDAYRRAKGK